MMLSRKIIVRKATLQTTNKFFKTNLVQKHAIIHTEQQPDRYLFMDVKCGEFRK